MNVKRIRPRLVLAGALSATLTALLCGCPRARDPRQGQTEATPPAQQESGPGAAVIVAADVRTTSVGTGAQEAFIYEPAGDALTSAPVIVFLHGYSGVNPQYYGAWIKHLVQRGNIVIYPVYQDTLRHPELYTDDALAAVQNAYATLRNGEHILPDDTKLAIVGHSLGGTIGMNLAAVAHTSGLPQVRALMTANPGDISSQTASTQTIQTGNYDQIPADVLYLGIVGADDDVVGTEIAEQLYSALTQVPQANREMLELVSDDHGTPVLRADHSGPLAIDPAFDSGEHLTLLPRQAMALLLGEFPTAVTSIDAIDFYGYWKWFDALTDAAFLGTNREYALGNTPQQTFMGTWSDGQAVLPATRIAPVP